MEVVAVSAALPRWHDINGKRTYTSIVRSQSAAGVLEVTRDGVKDNKTAVHDGPVYAFFSHHYTYWCNKLGVDRSTWNWCHWGENLTLQCDTNLYEDEFRLGDIWQIGNTVRLQVCGARVPCYKLAWRCGQKDKWLKELADTGFCGVYFRVLHAGQIYVGDRAVLLEKQNPLKRFDCRTITRLAFDGSLSTRDTMNLLVNDPDLVNMLRQYFTRKVSMMDDQRLLGAGAWKNWRNFKPYKIVEEGGMVKSFYVKPVDGKPLANYIPGQFISVRVPNESRDIRSWTISDWVGYENPAYYRISIKRANKASLWMCSQCNQDTILELRSPAGHFHMDWTPQFVGRQVYLSAGIGITPMITMIKAHSAHPAMRKAPALWLHACQNSDNFPFEKERAKFPPALKQHIMFTYPLPTDVLGEGYHERGRPSLQTLTALVQEPYHIVVFSDSATPLEIPGKMSTFYMCGTQGFQSSMKEYLHDIGVPEMMIHCESFTNGAGEMPDIERSEVLFSAAESRIKTHAVWNKKEPLSLLEVAEKAGLTPDYGCRVGACGSCKAKLLCGRVAGGMQPDGTLLLCTARPASIQVEIEM